MKTTDKTYLGMSLIKINLLKVNINVSFIQKWTSSLSDKDNKVTEKKIFYFCLAFTNIRQKSKKEVTELP